MDSTPSQPLTTVNPRGPTLALPAKQRWLRRSSWAIFTLWLLLQLAAMVFINGAGASLVDFAAYERAAQALESQRSPYGDAAATQAIWRSFHAREQALLLAPDQPARVALIAGYAQPLQQPGPYLYPPSLALFVGFFGVTGVGFGALSLLALAIFGWLWLESTRRHPAWLLLIVGSVEVTSTLHGGNVELLLLTLTLGSAWLLWQRHGLAAAPLLAVIFLIKPFYILFFSAFAALQLGARADRAQTFRTLIAAGAGSLALIGLEMLHWGAALRGQTIDYFRHAFDYQWFALPVSEQTPMSVWNRTPLQALVSAGVALNVAQWLAVIGWAVCLLVTLWLCRGRPLTFPLVFALALCLLYLGRPIGWTLLYLDLVILTVCWPALAPRHRYVLLGVTIGVLLSRWWAFGLTAQGQGMPLMTLQQPQFPWETLGLLVGGWLLLLAQPQLKRLSTAD
ncbi:MAG: DUF2029 domain-containing protein [Herpetosiphonaceae bacterium]|nr:DUF2029 domain-containing protein [Herpetosiphonaceae bacterium]